AGQRARPRAARALRGRAGAHPARHAPEREPHRDRQRRATVRRAWLLLCPAALYPGCIHLQRTDRLDEARAAYEKALQGPAAEASPADLATAKKWLDVADAALDTGDPKVVDDRATVAILKIQAAEALGRTHELAIERDRTVQALSALKQQLLDQTQQKLALT